jgi:hypothetical protein
VDDNEKEIFDAASAKDDFTTEEVTEKPVEEPVKDEPEAPVAEPEPTESEPEQPEEPNRGDPRVALRQEREARKQLQQDLERERAERIRFMNMLEQQRSSQPQKEPDPKPEGAEFWQNPEEWVNQRVEERVRAQEEQVVQMRLSMSRREATREHGEERVNAAFKALEEAGDTGKIDPDATLKYLRHHPDPFAEIVRWHDSQPQVQEQRLRERLEAEFREKYGLGADGDPAPAQPEPAAPVPTLPSLNRAVGTAGAQQSGSIGEGDIFSAAPAFSGKRRA